MTNKRPNKSSCKCEENEESANTCNYKSFNPYVGQHPDEDEDEDYDDEDDEDYDDDDDDNFEEEDDEEDEEEERSSRKGASSQFEYAYRSNQKSDQNNPKQPKKK